MHNDNIKNYRLVWEGGFLKMKWKGKKIITSILLFQPTHNLYTLKTLKSHIKTLNICPYMFRSLMKPSSGGS
jgi:hypothetical protein